MLLVGLHRSSVDYAKWPDLSPEKLNQAFDQARGGLEAAGFEAEWCLTDTGLKADYELSSQLEKYWPQVVMIGAGLRTDPDHLLLFENMLNIIQIKVPAAKIVFNSSPFDTVKAVQRWA